jgi:serine/threonine-protein kinase
VVYRGRVKHLPRDVAVKVLHGFLAKQEDARQRFHREAVAVAKLHHPGIVEIFDYSGPDAPETYIVTELISGSTLRDFFDKHGPFPHPEMGALIIAELCRPLAHAHEQGVIHRDLKPENVMVTLDGHLKLMDFGIAQIQDGQKLTLTGTLLGSPAHMAPEVIDGERPDARADVFSLGTMLYWLAVGKLPFSAPNLRPLRRILRASTTIPRSWAAHRQQTGQGHSPVPGPIRDARYGSVLELHAVRERAPVGGPHAPGYPLPRAARRSPGLR